MERNTKSQSARKQVQASTQDAIVQSGIKKVHADFIDGLYNAMEIQNVSRSVLAGMTGDSTTMSARTFNPNTNITLRTIVKNAEALDCDVKLELCPRKK